MKLTSRVALNLTLVMLPVLMLWGALFYFAMVDEINDEADDALEDYAQLIIIRHLAGRELPEPNNGSNNSYSLRPIDSLDATTLPRLNFYDANLFIPEKGEEEPARVMTTVFRDKHAQWYELQVSTPTFEKDDLFETVLGWIIFLCLLLWIVGVVLMMWVFRRAMRPLYRLLGWLDRYQPDQPAEPIENDTQITEFRRLNEAAEQMAGRSEELYNRQKQFIGNASHELQTPLAVLGNRMEWMLDSLNLNEEQMAEVIRLLDTQRHLVRLNRNLLLLTKIDNQQFFESTEVDLVARLRNEADMLGEIFEEQEIRCRLDLPEKFVVEMNESLASILISNLLRNAYLHSEPATEVSVRIEGRTLTIENEGTEALDGERIFERFYKGSKREGSTGLGLPLVRAVAELYKLTVEYEFVHARHRFRITWPA